MTHSATNYCTYFKLVLRHYFGEDDKGAMTLGHAPQIRESIGMRLTLGMVGLWSNARTAVG